MSTQLSRGPPEDGCEGANTFKGLGVAEPTSQRPNEIRVGLPHPQCPKRHLSHPRGLMSLSRFSGLAGGWTAGSHESEFVVSAMSFDTLPGVPNKFSHLPLNNHV